MRWSRARSLTDLGELTAQWLEGTRRHPDHPEPDPETAEIQSALVRLNRSGEVATLSSQPGCSGELGAQRAGVDMVATPARAAEIAEAARAAGLRVLVATPPRWFSNPFTPGVAVSRGGDGQPVTDFGAPNSQRELSRRLGDPPAATLRDVRRVTVLDEHWGPSTRLWDVLAPAPDTSSGSETSSDTGATPRTDTPSTPGGTAPMSGIDEVRAALAQVTETVNGASAAHAQIGTDLEQATGMLHQVAASSARPEPSEALGVLAELGQQAQQAAGQLHSITQQLESYAASL